VLQHPFSPLERGSPRSATLLVYSLTQLQSRNRTLWNAIAD